VQIRALAHGGRRTGDAPNPQAIADAVQNVAGAINGEVGKLGTQKTAMTNGAAVLTAQADALARIAGEVDALDDTVPPPVVIPPPVSHP